MTLRRIRDGGAEGATADKAEISQAKGRKGRKGWTNLFQVGNYVKLTRTGSANGYRRILEVDRDHLSIVVDGKYDVRARVMNCAKLVAVGFVGSDADVGEALVSDANLLLAKVVTQCLDATEVVVFCTEFEVNNGAFLLVCCHN